MYLLVRRKLLQNDIEVLDQVFTRGLRYQALDFIETTGDKGAIHKTHAQPAVMNEQEFPRIHPAEAQPVARFVKTARTALKLEIGSGIV